MSDHHSFEQRKRAQFLDRVAAVLQCSQFEVEGRLSQARLSSVRMNALVPRPRRTLMAELSEQGHRLEPILWCPDGYFHTGDKARLADSLGFKSGAFYIQNASSLVPPLVLDAQPGDDVLDVCAAPGGKSAHIAALTGNDCRLWLNDSSKPRLNRLRQVVDRFGVKVDTITEHAGQYVDKYIDRAFDRILLDAQCSGEGMIDLCQRSAMRFWSKARIRKFADLQKRMLVAAFKLLKQGGTLVYSTCTFAPEENEAVIDHLLRRRDDAEVVPVRLPIPEGRAALSSWEGERFSPQVGRALRIMPEPHFEAFFVCAVTRRASIGAGAAA